MDKVIFAIVIAVAIIFGFPLLTQLLWSYIIPKVFPRFVEEGWIASEISYWVAFWFSLLPSLLGFRSSSSSK